MSISRICLIAIAVTCISASLASAQMQQRDPRELMYGTDSDKSRFKSKSARALMSKGNYETYRRALEMLDYTAAGNLLNAAFIREYPQFKRARIKPVCTKYRDCVYWEIYANATFKEYGYCRAVLDLKTTESEIGQRTLVAPRFALKPWPQKTEYSNFLVRRRDGALGLLISQAELNYNPALIKLAGLVKRGDVFNAGDEMEYYILRRACAVGSNCAALTPRLAELRSRIASDRISVIETKAQAKPPSRPRLQFLLLGEKL